MPGFGPTGPIDIAGQLPVPGPNPVAVADGGGADGGVADGDTAAGATADGDGADLLANPVAAGATADGSADGGAAAGDTAAGATAEDEDTEFHDPYADAELPSHVIVRINGVTLQRLASSLFSFFGIGSALLALGHKFKCFFLALETLLVFKR